MSKLNNYWKLYLLIGLVATLLSCSKDDSVQLAREGVFQTPAEDAIIEGELFLPEGEGPFPLMIIIPGSGNEPRQELDEFAEILNANGYALYTYDKRGVGNSTGSYSSESNQLMSSRAEDVIGILDLMATHARIDVNRMGIYGSSQGAWVNSVVFDRYPNISYIVMVSGGVASTGVEGYYCSLTDDPDVTIEEATAALASFDGAVGFDPISIIQRMTVPVLWIYGNEDRSHPARYDIEILNMLNKNNFTVLVYENTDHELIDVTTMQPPESYLSDLGQWLITNNP